MHDEVLALLDRYLVEIVEEYNLCPWAKSARKNGELQRGILLGNPPPLAAWIELANELLAKPDATVVMIVAPEFTGTLKDLREVRAEVAKAVSSAGVAEFHPDADLDLGSPARLVRFLRKSPHPMLQFVPLAILDGVRTADRIIVEPHQILAILAGDIEPPGRDIAETIADTNYATVREHEAAIVGAIDAINKCR